MDFFWGGRGDITSDKTVFGKRILESEDIKVIKSSFLGFFLEGEEWRLSKTYSPPPILLQIYIKVNHQLKARNDIGKSFFFNKRKLL